MRGVYVTEGPGDKACLDYHEVVVGMKMYDLYLDT